MKCLLPEGHSGEIAIVTFSACQTIDEVAVVK